MAMSILILNCDDGYIESDTNRGQFFIGAVQLSYSAWPLELLSLSLWTFAASHQENRQAPTKLTQCSMQYTHRMT